MQASNALHRAAWALLLLMLFPAASGADAIYLNAEGRKNLDLIRVRIRPTPLFTDPILNMPFIRGVVVGERPARNPKAPYKTLEGSPEYDVIAFDDSGDSRSEVATISDAWIDHIQPDIDSDLDVRSYFSNRDELAGVPLGSRAYFAMARRAADPNGKLGLWRNDIDLPPEPANVIEGGYIRFLKDPPTFTAADPNATKWSMARRAAHMEVVTRALAERLPTLHILTSDIRPSGLLQALTTAVARERAFRLSRTGFDRAALAMLVFTLDLATVDHPEPPAGDTAAGMIFMEGTSSLVAMLEVIEGAMPDMNVDPCRPGMPFCVDASQRAAVAIDALSASEGMFVYGYWRRFADALTTLSETGDGATTRANDRVDLREPALRLLVRALNPPATTDDRVRRRREATSREVRGEVYRMLLDDRMTRAQQAAARRALAAGGWGGADELPAFVDDLLSAASSWAGDAQRSTGERAAGMRSRALMCAITLRAISGLSGSSVPHQRAAAATILSQFETVRKRLQGPDAGSGDRVLLEVWNEAAGTQ